ncbi:TrmH family RNA methyltransferase [Flagellimonas flava]|uniref:RNA methyltransferase, TrmH family n=1 Tax=Flagellimonas flava TaxID=570519 RepID=A0A1M5NA04_9FLAO|nr:RNA methyltransferase [Allomuricauda flava]SHG86338.1 RNA methyltransferase, TrmH family [Allomuricauda flava]
MVTKNQIKLVASLQQKKYRTQHKLFVVEGKKTVLELVEAGLKVYELFAETGAELGRSIDYIELSNKDFKQISGQKTPSGILGVFHIPEPQGIAEMGWVVALDAVRDPGNLGTIIRLCDWFGITQLVCSEDTVDCYNPKVLQATMGSIARVTINYVDLETYCRNTQLPLYGAFMDGDVVYKKQMSHAGILVLGNEANGISTKIAALVGERIAIPQFGEATAESLNVATAAAILLNEIRR